MKNEFRTTAIAIGVSMAAVATVAVVRTAVYVLFDESIPYTPFYPAIIVATMYGRKLGGVVATIAAALAASFWLAPFGKPLVEEPSDFIGMIFFIFVGLLIVALCEAMRKAQRSAELAAEERQQLLLRERAARGEAEEANRLKDTFLASVSHELRTPLQAIMGWTSLLALEPSDRETTSRGLSVIERSVKMQSRLIEDILDTSRITSGKMRLSVALINPRQVIEAAIQTVALAADVREITIQRQYDEEANVLLADADRLQQIMWNLLSNAIKFSPKGSTIQVVLRKLGNDIKIQVSDEGEGIEPDFLPHIYETFRQADGKQTRRHGGLGLGLAIVKHLVELHGGSIQAVSEGKGRGSSMIINLPAPPVTRMNDEPRCLQPGRHKLAGVRVLVVDDDLEACDLVRRILEEEEAEVTVACSVDEALESIDLSRPDVVVSDIGMPRRDGYELLRHIRMHPEQKHRPIHALALTAYSAPDDRRRSFEAGYELHMVKPVEAQVLKAAVTELALAEDSHRNLPKR